MYGLALKIVGELWRNQMNNLGIIFIRVSDKMWDKDKYISKYTDIINNLSIVETYIIDHTLIVIYQK
jgi:hypothetical protein